MLKIDYIKKGANNQSPYMVSSFTSGANEIPTTIYKYETNLSEQRYIDSIMILTGTDNHKIPAIYLSNPNIYYDATITVLYATKTITFEEPTSSAGTVYIDIEPNEYFNFPDNILSLNFKLNTTLNQYSYLVMQNLIVEIGSYTDLSTTYIVFDNNMVGNGKLIWSASDVGLTKLFILGGKYYAITWQGFGSLLFNLQVLDTNEQHFLVDEYNNFIVDEIGNYLSFE